MAQANQKSSAAPVNTQMVAVPKDAAKITSDQAEAMTKEQLIQAFGNKSNAIRGLHALGWKPGPISRKLEIIYQFARNVIKRPLKRVIKDERDQKKGAADKTSAPVEK